MPAIRRLTLHHFRHMLQRPITTVMGPVTCRPSLILRLEDAEGAVGWGEIWCNFPPDGDLHRMRLASNILPEALATLPADGTAFDLLMVRFRNLAIQAGEPGPLAQIAAAVDIAMSDLAARRAGQPLAVFLGGTRRDVPAYASGISPDIWPEQLERMRARGFQHFKLRIGFGLDDAIPVAHAMAAALSPQETLRVDANQSWEIETALDRVEQLAGLNLRWLEEPLPATAPERDWQRLADATAIPLAAGENMRDDPAFQGAIAKGDIPIIQPDACKWGGVSGVMRVARAALAAGRTYCPHYLGGGVGLMASAQLLAAAGGDGILEVDSSENPLSAALSAHDNRLQDGVFAVPGGPGLGYEPDIGSVSDLLVNTFDRRVG